LNTLKCAALALLVAAAPAVQAQAYPAKPIKFVVAFAPGGGTDIVARVVGQRLSEVLGQPVVVENRAGAGGNIGARAVATAKPDGYTILVTSSAFLINPAVSRSAGYDPLKDFLPIIKAGSVPTVLVAHPSTPVTSFKDLVAQAKSKQFFYSSAGVGTVPYMFAEYANKREGVKLTHVPFSGAGPALNAVVAGHVGLAALSGETSGLKDFIHAGKLRALAVTSAKRWTARPEIPTVAEAGFPAYVTSSWIGLFAPPETPREIITRLNREIGRILAEPEVKAQSGRDWDPNTQEEFAAENKEEYATWIRVVKETGLKSE
jgi:tripartite-type tricarboxylate transporter receptor subunit TctC